MERSLPNSVNLIIDNEKDGDFIIGIYIGDHCPITRVRTDDKEEGIRTVTGEFWQMYDSNELQWTGLSDLIKLM